MTRFNKGQVPYGSYHSKLILFEFEDVLRVIVGSANLTFSSWESLSQVFWVQDFPIGKCDSEFKRYLKGFMVEIVPLSVRGKKVYKQEIDLDRYDFSGAIVKLVGSVNGRYLAGDPKGMAYGSRRLR